MRELSTSFMQDLSNEKGLLWPVLQRVQLDHTLMLSIRKDYINIYYRGGNILRLKELPSNRYEASFDKNYYESGVMKEDLPGVIESRDDASSWVDALQELKGIMDIWFSKHSKSEREFQQLLARENNLSMRANESEYFVSDIECSDSSIGARFDLLALRWLASQRKSLNNCRPALIEMKYGDGALGGSSGLLKHLEDAHSLICNGDAYKRLLETMETQFNQLDNLGLLRFNRVADWTKIALSTQEKPEVILVLADHNPRSRKLYDILNDSEIDAYDHSPHYELRFYVASFAGYGLHAGCMITLSQIRDILTKQLQEKL